VITTLYYEVSVSGRGTNTVPPPPRSSAAKIAHSQDRPPRSLTQYLPSARITSKCPLMPSGQTRAHCPRVSSRAAHVLIEDRRYGMMSWRRFMSHSRRPGGATFGPNCPRIYARLFSNWAVSCDGRGFCREPMRYVRVLIFAIGPAKVCNIAGNIGRYFYVYCRRLKRHNQGGQLEGDGK